MNNYDAVREAHVEVMVFSRKKTHFLKTSFVFKKVPLPEKTVPNRFWWNETRLK